MASAARAAAGLQRHPALRLVLLTLIGFGGGSLLGWTFGLVQRPTVSVSTGLSQAPG